MSGEATGFRARLPAAVGMGIWGAALALCVVGLVSQYQANGRELVGIVVYPQEILYAPASARMPSELQPEDSLLPAGAEVVAFGPDPALRLVSTVEASIEAWLAAPGAPVAAGTPVVELRRASGAQVRCYLPSAWAMAVPIGTPVTIHIDGREIAGQIASLGSRLRPGREINDLRLLPDERYRKCIVAPEQEPGVLTGLPVRVVLQVSALQPKGER